MRTPLLLATLLLLGCDATAPSTPADGPYPLARLSPTAAPYNWNSALGSAEVGAVATQQGWDRLYVRIAGHAIPVPTEGPPLRFRDSTLIYVAYGTYPTGAAMIWLDSARMESGTLVVHYTSHLSEGCGVPSAEVSPVDVAQVPRWEGPIQFVRKDSIQVCS